MPEWYKIFDILEKNKKVPFVDRIINKNKYPFLTDPETGAQITHKMAWGESNGKFFVFPTVDMIDKELVDLTKKGIDPMEYAFKNKNYIEFDTAEMADWFSKNYKNYWKLFNIE